MEIKLKDFEACCRAQGITDKSVVSKMFKNKPMVKSMYKVYKSQKDDDGYDDADDADEVPDNTLSKSKTTMEEALEFLDEDIEIADFADDDEDAGDINTLRKSLNGEREISNTLSKGFDRFLEVNEKNFSALSKSLKAATKANKAMGAHIAALHAEVADLRKSLNEAPGARFQEQDYIPHDADGADDVEDSMDADELTDEERFDVFVQNAGTIMGEKLRKSQRKGILTSEMREDFRKIGNMVDHGNLADPKSAKRLQKLVNKYDLLDFE